MKAFSAIILILSLTTSVLSQLVTTTNAAGNTIIEQITTNALGGPVTQTLQTVVPGATTAAATSATSAAAAATTAATPTTTATGGVKTQAQQGPVGQPGTTPVSPGGPIPYVYTTTDANGNYIAVTATFTPSFPATTPYTPTGTGTVLPYSVWLSMVGGSGSSPAASQAPNPASRAGVSLSLLLGALSIVIIGVVGRSIIILL